MTHALRQTTKPSLIVLAAGLGSRYGGDKQLAGVGPHGEPILQFTALDAAAAGFAELILVVRPDLEAVTEALFGRRLRAVLPVRYVHQPSLGRTRPWGTAHALATALDGLSAPCGVVNADDWYGPPALADLATWLDDGHAAEAGLIAFPLARTLSRHGPVNRGLVVSEAERVSALVEVEGLTAVGDGARGPDGRLHAGSTLVSMNLWGLRRPLYAPFRAAVAAGMAAHSDDPRWESQLPTVIMSGLRSGSWRIDCRATTASWCGLTFDADRPLVQQRLGEAIAAGCYPGLAALRGGATP